MFVVTNPFFTVIRFVTTNIVRPPCLFILIIYKFKDISNKTHVINKKNKRLKKGIYIPKICSYFKTIYVNISLIKEKINDRKNACSCWFACRSNNS